MPHRTRPLHVDIAHCRYQALIGVGGIGSGRVFALEGKHTLGREESRSGHFLDRRDYCKLHIVCHYVKALLGPEFTVLPVGQVGGDDVGRRLLKQMADAGLDIRYVARSPGDQTLFSLCLIYPDGTGGNLTTDDSACARVSAAFVGGAEEQFARFEGRGIALAMPEVPMEARARLLELGSQYGLLRAASFTSAEMREAVEGDMLQLVDLLSINVDEAMAGAGISLEEGSARDAVEAAIEALGRANPRMHVCITAGSGGSWSWDGERLCHVPAFPAQVVCTAGAGDAYLAGVIAGLTANVTLPQAQELATLVAALSTTSPHTIDERIDRASLKAFAAEADAPICDVVAGLLADRTAD